MGVPLTIEIAESRHKDMVKGQVWTGNSSKYWFKCKKHGNYEQAFAHHDQGKGCKICGGKLTIEEVERRCPDMVKGQKWTGEGSEYWFICPNHGKYLQLWRTHRRGIGCRECVRESFRLTIKEAEARCPDIIKGQRWTGNDSKYWFSCKEHGEYLQSYSNHKGCPACGRARAAKSKLHTIEEMYELCPDMVPGQKAHGVVKKYWFKCSEHGKYLQQFSVHAKGARCPECNRKQRTLTIDIAEARQQDLIRGQVWRGTAAKYRYKCEKHGEYLQLFSMHDRGSTCQLCARGVPTTKEMYERYPDLIKGQEWRGAKHEYLFRCLLGHADYLQGFDNHSRTGCPPCGIGTSTGKRSLSIEEAESRCPDMVKGQVWKGSSGSYLFACEVHGEYSQLFSHHDQGRSCRLCAGTKPLTIEEAESRHPDLVTGQTWISARAKYLYKCPKGHEYRQTYDSHNAGYGCPSCQRSKGADRIKAYLVARFGEWDIEPEITFPTCRNIKRLRFDLCILSLGVLIEYQGMQHYETWHRDGHCPKRLAHTRKLDGIKRRWARKNGIRLICVPYTVKNIEAYLDKRLPQPARRKRAAKKPAPVLVAIPAQQHLHTSNGLPSTLIQRPVRFVSHPSRP